MRLHSQVRSLLAQPLSPPTYAAFVAVFDADFREHYFYSDTHKG